MQSLIDKILSEGIVIGENILKVDSFLNHQIDPGFMLEIGREFARRFSGIPITKILTAEASGIAVAMATGLALGVPVVFAKKKRAATQDSQSYQTEIFSFTKQESVNIYVAKKYLTPSEKILIVDDFLARGEALRGLVDIVQQSSARLAGVGIVIEKVFQEGGAPIRSAGIRIESLARILSMRNGNIQFDVEPV